MINLSFQKYTSAQINLHFFCAIALFQRFFFLRKFLILQSEEKIPARSRFFDAKFDGFWSFSQKVLQTQKLYVSHLKALILSCYEPEEQGA